MQVRRFRASRDFNKALNNPALYVAIDLIELNTHYVAIDEIELNTDPTTNV